MGAEGKDKIIGKTKRVKGEEPKPPVKVKIDDREYFARLTAQEVKKTEGDTNYTTCFCLT